MEDEQLEIEPFDDNKALKIAFICGIIFLCIGFYKAGYKFGAEEVIEYKEQYESMYCTCFDENIKKNNNIYPETKINLSLLT